MEKNQKENKTKTSMEKIVNGVNQGVDGVIELGEYIKKSNHSLDDLIFANIIVIVAVFLSAFIPIVSFSLPILFFIYLDVGLSGFVYKKECGKVCYFEELFVSIRKFIKTFCLFVIKLVLVVFGLCLFIVPGVVIFLNYIFTSIILFESEDMDVRSIMSLSKELAKGHRLSILFYIILALTSVCIVASVMFGIILLFDLFLEISAMFYIIFVVFAGVLDFIFVALPLIEIAIAHSYIFAKEEKFRSKQHTKIN